MMRLTPLSLAANTIFYLILAVMYCRVLTRRFSWPFTLLGLTVGYLLYIIPTKFMPYADAERMLFGLVTFPLTPIVLFRDKWYKSLLCAFAGLVAMADSDLLSVSWLLTPEQLRQGLTFQPIPVQLAVYAIFLSTDGLLMFLFTLLMNRYQNRLSGREWALYLAFPASQYLLIYGWVIFLRTDFILRRVLMLLLALAISTLLNVLYFLYTAMVLWLPQRDGCAYTVQKQAWYKAIPAVVLLAIGLVIGIHSAPLTALLQQGFALFCQY